MKDELEEKLIQLPESPGVYFFKDYRGKIIYVGKAKSLRHRVRSYFQSPRNRGPKMRALISKIDDLEFIVTDSEVEALILEANMVKEYKPRYNVTLKDDKSFPYIRVTNEDFPRIFPTRKIVKDGSRYFGPYTDVHTMRDLLKTVRRIFPIRSCNYRLDPQTVMARKIKLCLDYYIHRCSGPCQGLISVDDYKKMVEQMVRFIEGKNTMVVSELRKQMEQFAQQQRFEEAARVRDQIEAIEIFRSKQKMVSTDEIDRDIVAVYHEDEDACGVVFKVREGKIIGRQHFFLQGVQEKSVAEILKSFLQQYYLKIQFLPAEIFLPFEIEDLDDFEKWLSKKHDAQVKLIVPKIGEKAKLMQMAMQNAKLLLEELNLQKMKAKEEYVPNSVKALQEALHLPNPPRRIEAFDISNLAGTHAVGSMVTFVNGRPYKSGYRHFKIKTVEGIDDFAMMKEVIGRRYRRVLQEQEQMPDLILVDGGKGQLSSALESLRKLGVENQPIAALAKRLDEVFIPGISSPQNIPHGSPGLKLLQRIRDESHRFAISYHRKLRGKEMVSSVLDEIEGIGEVRKNRLLQSFGSIEKIKQASVEELVKVGVIPKNVAEKVWKYFHPQSSE